jgi:hypothetical protein
MKRLAAILVAVACCSPVLAREPLRRGPDVLANGDGYTIHLFRGLTRVDSIHRYGRVIDTGYVIQHTCHADGIGKWLLSTGTYSVPTRRISYYTSRLLGLMQTGTYLVLVVYESGRLWDRPPYEPPPEEGRYTVTVVDKRTGDRTLNRELILGDNRPEVVPKESRDLGIIKRTDSGFTVFDKAFTIARNGSVTVNKEL